MDAIGQFQESLAAPVYGFVGSSWPFLLVVAFVLTVWVFSPRWRDGSGAVIDMSVDGDKSADSDGGGDGSGDGGGGD